MTWQNQLKGDSITWLLEDSNPGVRYLALRDVLGVPERDAELRAARKAAHQSGPIAEILAQMDEAGFWVKPGPGYNPKYRSTVWSLILLAQLGARVEQDGRIARACAYYLEYALAEGGQISMNGAPSGTIDCLQGNLAWAILELGYEDQRMETAFEWMARTVTGEGLSPAQERQSPMRYYAYQCGPVFACGANNQMPCACGAAKVMMAFSKLPKAQRTPLIESAIQRGVDFLFSVDPATAAYPSGFAEKPSRNWWKFGFPVFYVTDILQIVEDLVNLGYKNDARLASALALIVEKQDEKGRWALEYHYAGKTWIDFGAPKQANAWVTLRAARVLKMAGETA